jgi:DNA repair photolyase
MEFINAVKIVQSVSEGWFGATYNMNIYKGCNQGCIYCDSRSSCYQIQNFDTIRAKQDAPLKVEKELSKKRKVGIITMGGMSDPYNYLEKKLEYTRSVLKSINKYQFGVSIITKSTLVLRDIDILKEINKNNAVSIGITITTSNDRLQSRIERNVPSTTERFQALKTLKEEGLYCGVLMMPILPFINDTVENIDGIVEMAHEANVDYIYPSFGVTLRDNQRLYFFEKIGETLTKQYIDEFKDSYLCVSPNHMQLKERFITLCEKYGIVYKMEDIVKGMKENKQNQQISLF